MSGITNVTMDLKAMEKKIAFILKSEELWKTLTQREKDEIHAMRDRIEDIKNSCAFRIHEERNIPLQQIATHAGLSPATVESYVHMGDIHLNGREAWEARKNG
jgi:hypothetical protein